MILRPLIAALAASLAAGGCATAERQAENEAYRAPLYRTGSNLPAGRETGESTGDLSAAERRTIEDLQNRQRVPVGPVVK